MARRELDLLVEQNDENPIPQENFDRIRLFLEEDLFTKFDGAFFELSFSAAVTNEKVPHNLGFLPSDIFITSQIGAGTITFNQDKTSLTDFDITTTGAVDVRFVAGSFVIDR